MSSIITELSGGSEVQGHHQLHTEFQARGAAGDPVSGGKSFFSLVIVLGGHCHAKDLNVPISPKLSTLS